jgi:hypothetical protein
MNEKQLLLESIKKANPTNPILAELNINGVAFIDYKDLGDIEKEGIQVNTCMRLKTLPNSGFVGSRKIYYKKLSLSSLYPNLVNFLIFTKKPRTYGELFDDIKDQTGYVILTKYIEVDVSASLPFNDDVNHLTIKAKRDSLYIGGSITFRYTANRKRCLNYIKNRSILLSENTSRERDYIVHPSSYYFDLSLFPPDYLIFLEHGMLSDYNKEPARIPTGNQKYATTHYTNLPDYFEDIRSIYVANNLWENPDKYTLQRIIQAYLKYMGFLSINLNNENQSHRDAGFNTSHYSYKSGELSYYSLANLGVYFIGKTEDLVKKILGDTMYPKANGNCGVNDAFEKVFALRFITNSGRPTGVGINSLLTFYWGVKDGDI